MNLIIYDNSPNPLKIANNYSNIKVIKYISNTKNPGVSAAYNYAWKYCIKEKKLWLLLLDQDSKFPVDYINELSNSLLKQKHLKIFVAAMKNSAGKYLSPCKYQWNWNFPLSSIDPGEHSISKFSLINCSLTIQVDTLTKVGGFNSALPLDFSDSFLIDKLRALHYRFYLMNVECEHHLSSQEQNLDLIKSRYLIYSKSSKIYFETIGKPYFFSLFLLIRALKLCFKHRSLFFIKTFLKE